MLDTDKIVAFRFAKVPAMQKTSKVVLAKNVELCDWIWKASEC